MRVFTYADGLPRSNVVGIARDRHGFLWLCTADGLTRYDGYRFHTFNVAEGLPRRQVTAVMETRGGMLLAATLGGIARAALPASGALPERFTTIAVEGGTQRGTLTMLESRRGEVWAGAYGGLYRLRDPGGAAPKLEFVELGDEAFLAVNSLAEDAAGTIWMGTGEGVWRMRVGGRPERVPVFPREPVTDLLVDRHGTLWVGGVKRLRQVCISGQSPRVENLHGTRNGLAGSVAQLFESRDGRLWAATTSGLSEWHPEVERWQNWDASEGIPGWGVSALAEDGGGNLWAGADHGLACISRTGFARITATEGMGPVSISTIFEHGGRIRAITNELNGPRILTWESGKVTALRPNYAASLKSSGWGTRQRALVDHRGAWWIATGEGLYRFAPGTGPKLLAADAPKIYFPGSVIFRIFEERTGAIWIARVGQPLARFTPGSETLEEVDVPGTRGYISAFAEDRGGNLWIALSNDLGTNLSSAVLRFRNGAFERFTGADLGGVSAGWIADLLVDGSGALWAATSEKGLLRAADPAAETPKFEPVSAKLSNSIVTCLAQGPRGRVLAAGPRGLDSIDPVSGVVRNWTVAQGYPLGDTAALYVDGAGAMWAGTSRGLARMDAAPEEPTAPPSIYVTAFRAAGRDLDPGAANLAVEADSLEMEYVSPDAISGRKVGYRFRLLGAGNDWTNAIETRSVRYGRLPAGAYRFEVKAVSEGGQEGAPAAIVFEIPKPFWRRTWFLLTSICMVLAVAGAVRTVQIRRLRQLEGIRAGIAADLHDDLGAGLTRIAILSENIQLRGDPATSAPQLEAIAESSRDMMKSMSDIVWAVDPRSDNWGSLARRLRELCGRLFDSCGVAWSVELEETMADAGLRADRRRHLYLIAKEALTNAARHAAARNVRVKFEALETEWRLIVEDDGRGFAPESVEPGNGLGNLRNRARQLGGMLTISTAPEGGTRVACTIPSRARKVSRIVL